MTINEIIDRLYTIFIIRLSGGFIMKGLKTILGVVLATTGFGGAVAIGASATKFSNNNVQVAEAATSDYYIVGSFNSWAAPGNETYRMKKDDGSTDLGYLKTYHIEANTVFAFAKSGWANAVRWAGLNSGGGNAKPFFENANDGDKNIKCLKTGDYNIFINSSSQVYIDFSNGTNAYIQLNGWSNTYIYAFDETTLSGHKIEQFGGWPGQSVASSSGNSNFNNAGGVGKVYIAYHTLANTKIIIHNNSGVQTSDLALLANAYYTNNATAGNTNLGSAASLIVDVIYALNDSNNTHHSVCSISQSTASTLYSTYNSLNSTAKAAVNASTLYTYKDSTMIGEEDVSYSTIMNRLYLISTGGSNSNKIAFITTDNKQLAFVITSILVFASSIGLFFFINKKRFHK